MSSEEEPPRGFRLTKWQRRGVVTLLIALAVLRFFFPGLPIDPTLLALLGTALVVWKFDIESIEFGGLKARGLLREFEESEAKIKALPPAETVSIPDVPEGPTSTDVAPDWLTRAAAAATDLHVPSASVERILWAAEHIRIELTVLAGNSGQLGDRGTPWHAMGAAPLAGLLVESNVLPDEVAKPIPRFLDVRNQVAHGRRLSPAVLDSVADAGLSLVTALRAIPREWVRVVTGGIRIWADRTKTSTISTGVLLVQVDQHGKLLHRAVYPSGEFYPQGGFVTWEWDMSRSAPEEGWYEDPADGEMKMAWGKSTYFAGRAYPDEWGLMYRFPRPDVGLEDTEASEL